MEIFQNFATKGFTGTRIHVFLPSFAEIGEAEVTKRMCGIHHEKSLYFNPLSMASTQSSMRYMQKCLTDSLQYRREACRFLADNNHAYLRWLYAVNTTRTQVSQDDK